MPDAALRKAVADYAELELEIDRLVKARLSDVCAHCEKQCCRPDVCEQAVENWWLRQVSRHVHGQWWPDDWESARECIAMAEAGCLLKAGRPLICRSFVCDHYVEAYGDLWEAVFYSFVADLLWETSQLSSRVSLETLEADKAPKYAEAIARRIATGRRQLDLAKRLLDPAVDELAKHRITLRLLCEVPRFLRATTRRAILARLDGG